MELPEVDIIYLSGAPACHTRRQKKSGAKRDRRGFGFGRALFLSLWVSYLLLKKCPRRRWLYTSLPFLFLVMPNSPIRLDPLFNRFGPMKDKALESEILALAKRAGIEGSRVCEVNKSVDAATVNAYGTGFLGTKRIVPWTRFSQS